jgi:multiple sugar transport system permease protein
MTSIARSVGGVGGLVTRRLDRLTERQFAFLAALPSLLIIGLVLLPPILAVLVMSLFRIELVRDTNTPFVGLGNYQRILRDADFMAAVPRTIVLGIATTALSIPLALFAAMVLNRAFRGATLLGVAILLPWAIAPVVTGQFWQFIFNSHFGILTGIANALGLADGSVRWLEDTRLALGVAVVATAWRNLPLLALILLAALKQVPESQYRAARMDGATAWETFRHITVPSIRTSLLLVSVLSIILSLSIFDILFTLTGGGPGRDTTVMPYYVYLRAFQNLSLGYSAALAVVLLATVVGCSLLLVWVRFRRSGSDRASGDRGSVVPAADVRAVPLAELPAPEPRRRVRLPPAIGRVAFGIGAVALAVWLLAPIVWIAIASLQQEGAVTTAPPELSLLPTFDRYGYLLGHPRWAGSLVVSSVVALSTMVITLVLGAIAAYPLARLQLWGRNGLLAILAFTQMIPGVVMAIPILLMFQWAGLRDTIAGLVIIDTAFLLPLVIWLLRNYIADVPVSMESAARIDGCSRLGTLFRVTLPAAAPGIAAVAILVLIACWNEFLFALVLGDREAVTVTRRITDLQSLSPIYGVIYTERAAAGMLAVLPPLLLVVIFHRRIVGGIAQGLGKG